MSDASSAVTYTSVYTDSEPWRYYREESAETGSPGVIVPKHPPSPVYVPDLEYPKYLVPSEDETPRRIMLTILLMEGMVMMSPPMMMIMMILMMTDSSVVPIVDPIPPARDTKAFKTHESAPTPRSPQTIIPFSQTRLHREWRTVRH
nr:hypothetical protein [Tanacetum cinerariifolium]